MTRRRNLSAARSGATAVEFALVAGIFIPLCLAVLGAGLLMWTKGALQSTAALTARCAAIASPDCADAQQFAVTTAANWIFAGIIVKADVVPAPAIVCISGTSYMKVTISSKYWAGTVLPRPFRGKTLTSVAFYPVVGPACS
ncbi:MAG: TadE family protein [Acetobacteraceae bacterium]